MKKISKRISIIISLIATIVLLLSITSSAETYSELVKNLTCYSCGSNNVKITAVCYDESDCYCSSGDVFFECLDCDLWKEEYGQMWESFDPTHTIYYDIYKDATCYEWGYYVERCMYCRGYYDEYDIPPLGHDYKNGICTRCHEINPDQQCGDNIIWTFNEATGTITFSGSGEFYRYSTENRPWAQHIDNIKNVVIKYGITDVGTYAFYGCKNLTEVELPNTINKIEKYSFANCSSLEDIVIPKGVEQIIDGAFNTCSSLETVKIPKSVTSVGRFAFRYCDNLSIVYYESSEEDWNKILIDTYNQPLLDAKKFFNGADHDCVFGDWVYITKPTCTERGLEKRICTKCEKYETQEVSATGHTLTWHTLSVAGCNTDGVNHGYCNDCSYFEVKTTPMTGHQHKTVVTPPTCTEQGYTTYTCTCGDSYVDNYVVALGHADNDDDGYCDDCPELLDATKNCGCNCHKSGISNFFFKFALFFQKFFGSNKTCSCGVAHY